MVGKTVDSSWQMAGSSNFALSKGSSSNNIGDLISVFSFFLCVLQ